MLAAALFTVATKVETTPVPINRRLDKQSVVCTHHGILLGHRKDEVVTHATAWMNLNDIMPSPRNQTQKDSYCVIPLTGNILSRQVHRNRRLEVTRGYREWEVGCCCLMSRVCICGDEEFWK